MQQLQYLKDPLTVTGNCLSFKGFTVNVYKLHVVACHPYSNISPLTYIPSSPFPEKKKKKFYLHQKTLLRTSPESVHFLENMITMSMNRSFINLYMAIIPT